MFPDDKSVSRGDWNEENEIQYILNTIFTCLVTSFFFQYSLPFSPLSTGYLSARVHTLENVTLDLGATTVVYCSFAVVHSGKKKRNSVTFYGFTPFFWGFGYFSLLHLTVCITLLSSLVQPWTRHVLLNGFSLCSYAEIWVPLGLHNSEKHLGFKIPDTSICYGNKTHACWIRMLFAACNTCWVRGREERLG